MASLLANISEFHFIRPWWLLGVLLPVLFWHLRRKKRSHSAIDDLVDTHLQSVVVDLPEQQASNNAGHLLMFIIGLLSVALAGPSWERLPQPLHQLQQGRVLVLSLSESMNNRDMQPSRLKRAKFKLADLLSSAPGVLTGLVAFAGEAFVVAPLSDDQDTISNLLQSLDTTILPVQGIRAERGLQKAADLLDQVNIDSGEIILVADLASPLAVSVAANLRLQGVRISVLEVAPLDAPGQRDLFENIARAGGGVYARLSANDKDITRLNKPLQTWLSRAGTKTKISQRSADQWRDTGPYILIPILLLSSLLFRRGWIVFALPYALPLGLALIVAWPYPSSAFELDTLWRRNDQTQWQAAKAYREQNYHAAMQGFKRDKTAEGYFNQANTLAQIGQLEEAISAYDKALGLKPNFEDAVYNREIVKAALNKTREEESLRSSSGKNQQSPSGEGEENGDANQTADEESAEDESNRNSQASEGQDDKQLSGSSGGQAEQGMQMSLDEDEQSLQMMLRQVPDDPGALLRRKFARQYSDQLSRRQSQ